ncbi:FLX-like protein 1 [Tanacetum coccineum]|uniref:FLX-like protein 1 n=1 Tax=Tanacetum coccineum TaxID=301880 RepID=A0ABQ4XCC4_9ASTR
MQLLCNAMFSLEPHNMFFSGFVSRLSNPFHDIDNKSLTSKDTTTVDKAVGEPVTPSANNYKHGQVMEKNSLTMAWELEKFRAEVANAEKRDRARSINTKSKSRSNVHYRDYGVGAMLCINFCITQRFGGVRSEQLNHVHHVSQHSRHVVLKEKFSCLYFKILHSYYKNMAKKRFSVTSMQHVLLGFGFAYLLGFGFAYLLTRRNLKQRKKNLDGLALSRLQQMDNTLCHHTLPMSKLDSLAMVARRIPVPLLEALLQWRGTVFILMTLLEDNSMERAIVTCFCDNCFYRRLSAIAAEMEQLQNLIQEDL